MRITESLRIFEPEDLLKYTGTPTLPPERPQLFTPEGKKMRGKRGRKVISGVVRYSGGHTSVDHPIWRAKIMKSDGEKSKGHHKAFTYDCATREEAAYIVTMAHRRLKPWFFNVCQGGVKSMRPARPGDQHYFWNDIWGLWRYAFVTGDAGERFFAIAIPGFPMCFITDFREDIYAALVRAPFFCRATINKKKIFEPVQPQIFPDGDGGVKVEWTRLSEVVFREPVDLPPERLGTFDFRLESLKGNKPPLPFQLPPALKNGWMPAVEPVRFNAVEPAINHWAVHHPYGTIHF